MLSRMEALIEWSGRILDRIMHRAPEETQDSIAVTVMEMVLPSVAIKPTVPQNDD